MMSGRFQPFPPVRTLALGLLWLAIFSLLYTLGVMSGAWSSLPLGRFRDLELFVGFTAGALLLGALLRRPGQSAVRDPQSFADRIG
jgi:hypothetical protein